MIAMCPIREYDVIEVIEFLDAGRFSGDIEGYIVMNGPGYPGRMLYRAF